MGTLACPEEEVTMQLAAPMASVFIPPGRASP